MWAFLMIHLCDKMSDAISRLGDALIVIDVNFFSLRVRMSLSALYCHRKTGPLSKTRLCYNTISQKGEFPMAKRKRRTFSPEFKAEVVLEALRVKAPKRNCVSDTTSAKSNSQSGNSNSLKTRHLSLSRGISRPRRLRSGSRNWSNSLAG